MRHLLLCRELPPVSGGGIGAYTTRIAELLAERGETVHIISQLWNGTQALERRLDGRLVIHRVPCERPGRTLGRRPHRALRDATARVLFESAYYPQAFAWSAGLLAERLVEDEGIDVIEAPEYEAPLYFFQLRRALGLGPSREPPCVIHLHSPTEIIARSNDWDLGHPYFLTAKRLEDFSMSAADALICPSHYLADEIAARADLRCEDVHVIHYPAPQWTSTGQEPGPNATGPVVHVGRLERRKGSIEWLDAAAAAARTRPDVRFDFVGRPVLDTDWRSGEEVVEDHVPSDVRSRFRFHGQKSPAEVRAILRGARLAVVPSRWDNFPNTCVEAMSLGVPVLATPNGGMAQLVEDGRTGWLSEGASAADLYAALMRALDTPEAELASLGRAASETARERCDPQHIVDAHLELKSALVQAGAGRSLRTPPVLRPRDHDGATPAAPSGTAPGIGVVVVSPARAGAPRCLAALAAQTVFPVATLVVRHDPAGSAAPGPAAAGVGRVDESTEVHPDRWSAIRAGLAAIGRMDPPPVGVAVLDEHDLPLPTYVERCRDVLVRCPEVGLVSFWEGPAERPWVRPCPARPYQWAWNDAAAASVVRVAALGSLESLPACEEPLYERWFLANAVISRGWAGVTLPERLAARSHLEGWVDRQDSSRMARAVLRSLASEIGEDAPDLLLLTRSGTAGTLRARRFRPRALSELAALLASQWRQAARWGWRRALRRLRG